MRRWLAVLVLVFARIGLVHADHRADQAFKALPTPDQSDAIPLYEGAAPEESSEPSHEEWLNAFGQRIVRNVSRPTLTVVAPEPSKVNGTAVVVAPGGAFLMLSIDNEGYSVAHWLADHGYTAFILKYRLLPTPEDHREFMRALADKMIQATKVNGQEAINFAPGISDGLAAVALVRSRAAQWGVDPHRVGLLGFSAGAVVALKAALTADVGTRPDFVAPIYGPMDGVAVPADAPPMFVGLAADDPLFGRKGLALVEAWAQARRPVELHYFSKGGHGFASGQKGTTSDHWIDEFGWWLEASGLSSQPSKEK